MRSVMAIPVILIFAARLIAADPVEAKPPTITGEKTSAWMIDLKVTNVPQGTAIIWDVFSQDSIKMVGTKRVIKTEQGMLFAGPKGKYDVLVRLVKGDDVKELKDVVELTEGVPPVPPGPPTPVPPGPTPIPPGPTPVPPEPARKGVSYQIVYVVDTKTSADSAAPMFANRTLNELMDKNGHSWRIVTKNNTGPDVQEEIKKSDGKGYPQLFLNDKGGKLKQLQFNAPMKAEDMIKILANNGG